MARKIRTGADPAKDILKLTDAIVANADRIRTVTFNTVKGQLVRRIFNEGTASDGTPIGQYRPLTKKIRALVGRQVAKADLEMTGTLRRSVVVGVADGMTVLGIIENQKEPVISVKGGRLRVIGASDFSVIDNAIAQEENFNKEIFAPSDQEIKRGEKTVLKEINLVAQKALK